MPADTETPTRDAAREFQGLASDLGRLLENRRRLIELEVQDAKSTLRRTAWDGAVALILGVAGLSLLSVAALDRLQGVWGFSREAWGTMGGLGLSLIAIVVARLALLRFRRDFRGLRDSLDELREDVAWLRDEVGITGDPNTRRD